MKMNPDSDNPVTAPEKQLIMSTRHSLHHHPLCDPYLLNCPMKKAVDTKKKEGKNERKEITAQVLDTISSATIKHKHKKTSPLGENMKNPPVPLSNRAKTRI
jgi:hypothetical protein